MTFGLNYTISLRQMKPEALFWPVPVMENAFGTRQNFSYPRPLAVVRVHGGGQEQAPRPHHGAVQLDGPRRWPADHQLGPRGRALAPRQRRDRGIARGARHLPRRLRPATRDAFLDRHRLAAVLADRRPEADSTTTIRPEVSDWYAQVQADPNMHLPVLPPPFNEAERERLKRPDHRRRQHPQPGARRLHRRHGVAGRVRQRDAAGDRRRRRGDRGDLQRRGGAPALVADPRIATARAVRRPAAKRRLARLFGLARFRSELRRALPVRRTLPTWAAALSA